MKDKVAGLALVQCPYGGTPLASDVLREGQVADKETRRIMEFLICKLIKVRVTFYYTFSHLLGNCHEVVDPMCMYLESVWKHHDR